MGAGLLRHALAGQPEPLCSLKVGSAGIAARHGEAVSENSVIAMKKVGIDIRHHRSRPLTQKMLEDATLVICMTESHRAMINVHSDHAHKHIYLFREFLPAEADKEIGDPYGGPLKVYELCRDEMVEAIPSLIELVKTRLAAKPA